MCLCVGVCCASVCVCVYSYINFNVKCLNKVLSLCTILLSALSLSLAALTSLCQGHFYACRSRRRCCCCCSCCYCYCSCLSAVEISLNDRQHDADLIINRRGMSANCDGKIKHVFVEENIEEVIVK